MTDMIPIPIKIRHEAENVPNGVSLTMAGRLHIYYQEQRGDEVFRFSIAIPFPATMFGEDLVSQCHAKTETYDRG
jgi:hypothetical protein